MIDNDFLDEAIKTQVPTATVIDLYKTMLRLRKAELLLAERYKQQEMRTPTHFGVGQEAVATGVCHALKRDDVVYSHHRSHNHFLAKGGSAYRLAAELFGRKTGCSGGRGGSVHLTDRENGFIASSAILGEAIAAATGSALAIKMDSKPLLSTAFFGDAVAEEGAFYECLSYAALHHLPVLYVCENNGYATESPLSQRQPSNISIWERVKSFGIPAIKIDGNDVIQVYSIAVAAINTIRESSGPFFVECQTYRWLEHVGPHYDHDLNRIYRTKEELELWQQKCPLLRCKNHIEKNRLAETKMLNEWEEDIQSRIIADIEKAYKDEWPAPETLLNNVY